MNKKLNTALNYIEENEKKMISFLEKLVNIESGSDNKKGIDSITPLIIKEIDRGECELKTFEYETSGNLNILTYKTDSAKKDVIFIGHADTVFEKGTISKRPFKVKKGIAYGPGVLDMKGGLVIGTYILKAFYEAGFDKYNIKFYIAGDEETGHVKSDCDKKMFESMLGAKAAFTLETGFIDNGLVVGRKGAVIYKLKVKGKAAHTGNDPKKGRNAIWEIAKKICKIQELTDEKKGILYNVGKIEGGTAPNVFPDKAEIIIGVRYEKKEQEIIIKESLDKITNEFFVEGTNAELSFIAQMQPMERKKANNELFEIIKKSALELNQEEPYPKLVGGGSDSAYSVLAGVPTVCALGVKGEGNHSENEYAVLSSLMERAKLIIQSIYNL